MRNLIFCLALSLGVAAAAAENPAPTLDEVLKLLSTNLDGATQAELNHAAVQGLVGQLGPRVSLVDSATSARDSAEAPVAEARIFDGAFAYVRVASVTSNLPAVFRATYGQLSETNKDKIKGLVLDLRFAGGTNYEAAAKMADCFLNSDRPLLDWQSGKASATKKEDAILAPVAILVNGRTTGAAEAVAAVLREANAGLILGATTAGQASVYKQFALRDGQELRVAVAAVSLRDGKTLAQGVVPDIAITASLEDERAHLRDPYEDLHPGHIAKAGTGTATNRVAEPPRRFNEAELVREHKAGEDGLEEQVISAPAPEAPVIKDAVLARALDLLKGLAIVQPNRAG